MRLAITRHRCKTGRVTSTAPDLSQRYSSAAARWSDKMRVLGYLDGYLGFLSHRHRENVAGQSVIDIGTGTGAMAEAFVAVNGPPAEMTLLDPSERMLNHARDALMARKVAARMELAGLTEETSGQFDTLLAAHVIEHFDDPAWALAQMRRISRPGAQLWLVVSKPHWCSVLIWLKWRHRTFRQDEIVAMLGSAGFEPEGFYAFPAGPPSRTSFGVVARAV